MHLFYLFLLLPIYAVVLALVGRRELKNTGTVSLAYKIQALTIILMSCFIPMLMGAINNFMEFQEWGVWLVLPVIVFALVWVRPQKSKDK